MRQTLITIIILLLFIVGCGNSKNIQRTWFETKGVLINDEKHPCIHYEIILGNVFWGIVLLETLMAPIYFFGWSIFEPKHEKTPGCLKDYAND